MGQFKGALPVLCGGAPCQGFSLIGQRALNDPRNKLVLDFIRLAKELRPSYIVFENVKGLTVGRQKKFLEEVVEGFDKVGYEIVMPWRVLNALHYGVPQHRERLFLIGSRKGLPLPQYPEATTSSKDESLGLLRPTPTCADALDDLPDLESYTELFTCDAVMVDGWSPTSDYAQEMHCESLSKWHFAHRREWNPNLLTSSLRTDHTNISRRRFINTPQGSVEPISRFYKLSAEGYSNTLRAGTDSARGAFTSPRPIHYKFPRCISVREMARLHGFPDWFRFHSTKWHGARQIGNAVPPPLSRAIAKAIAQAMGYTPEVSNEIFTPKATGLLSMDMSNAASYWGVPIPIGKRDRKSGAKKRKQVDIEAEKRLTNRKP